MVLYESSCVLLRLVARPLSLILVDIESSNRAWLLYQMIAKGAGKELTDVAQWLRASNIFRHIYKSTSEWRGFESRILNQ